MKINKKMVNRWQFIALGAVLSVWPGISFAQEATAVRLGRGGEGNVFVLQEKDGILDVATGELSQEFKEEKRSLAVEPEKVLSLGDLRIDSGNIEKIENSNDVLLTSRKETEKKLTSSKKNPIVSDITKKEFDAILPPGEAPWAAWIDDVWNVGQDVVFGSRVTFEDSVDFLSQTIFMERIMFADQDMAGRATIKKGGDSTHVVFRSSYSVKPYVVAVANSDFAALRVANVSEEGFDILTRDKTAEDLTLTWHAVAIFNR
ncbi:MAG: hypothetical protein WC823_03840 [Parcubacteria group bacterium]|jgi:hypothetical protein